MKIIDMFKPFPKERRNPKTDFIVFTMLGIIGIGSMAALGICLTFYITSLIDLIHESDISSHEQMAHEIKSIIFSISSIIVGVYLVFRCRQEAIKAWKRMKERSQ